MAAFLMMFSWTKIGTIITILTVILSLPEVGAIIPLSLTPYFIMTVNAIMFIKRTFWPKEMIAGYPAEGTK